MEHSLLHQPEQLRAALGEITGHQFLPTKREPMGKQTRTGTPIRIWELVLSIADGTQWGCFVPVGVGDRLPKFQTLALEWYRNVRLGLSRGNNRWKQLPPASKTRTDSFPVPLEIENLKAALAEVASHRFTRTDLKPAVPFHWKSGRAMIVWEMRLAIKDGSEWRLRVLVEDGEHPGSAQSAALDWYEETRLGLSSRKRWEQLRPARSPVGT